MRYWSSTHTFDHPWETVVKAACRKYPNPLNTNVVGTDVIQRQVKEGVLHTHRLVTSEWNIPAWILRLFFHEGPYYASEWSIVDPKAKKMELRTVNVSLESFVSVGEVVRYTPHPDDPQKTQITQNAVVSITGMLLINHLETILTNAIEANSQKGRLALEWIIERFHSNMDDITSTAIKSSDELLQQTRRQIDGITHKTKRGVDDLQSSAKRTFDGLLNLPSPPPAESMPKL